MEDIKAIRKLMEESTRFLSLSGLSGISAGAVALAGAAVAYFLIPDVQGSGDYINQPAASVGWPLAWKLIAVASAVLILAVVSAVFFSVRKARKDRKNFWSPAMKRLLVNLLIPLATGGIFCILLLVRHNAGLIIPSMLIFYGLALVNAGKFTYGEIFYLGLLEIITGMAAILFPEQGLLLWAAGFGLLHIIYGAAMYRKYEA